MAESTKENAGKFFSGNGFKEIIANELHDFFYLAPHRKEFFLMSGYSVLLLGAILVADFQNFFDTPSNRILWALAELAAYFIIADFLKRKKILLPRLQFLIDCIFYSSLMLQVIILTGGYSSPVAFTLLFLTCVSAPLYASLTDTIIFVTLIALVYGFLEVIQYRSFTTIFYFHLLEGLSLVVAAVTVKLSLDAFERKAEELEASNEKLESLNLQIGRYNERLEKAVNEKTKELSLALANMQDGEKELKKQKTAILNILEDMEEERTRTLLEKEKLSRILQSIGDAVFVVDQDKKIIIFNHVAEKISGYIAGEVIGLKYDKVIKFVHEADRKPNRTVDEVFVTKHIMEISGHTVLITKEGLDVPVADSAAPIMNPNGEIAGCIVVFRDVTRDREIDRQKTEFVSVASHQLRTPLTSIKWFLEMMIDGDMGKLTDEQIETLRQIFESNERMIDLVNKLLNVSRIESGRVRVEPKPTNMNELVKSVQAELTPLAAVKKINLEIKVPKLPEIKIDPKLIREALVNFVSNAIKYTNDSGSVSVAAEKGEVDVTFSVKDSGIGIPLEQQSKVFHKFFRADNAVAAETEGTGMGLYVAKSIVELSGGRVWFESRANKGSTFYFTLPLAGSQKVEGEKGLI